MKERKAIAFTIVACMLFAGVVIMTAPTASAASYTQAHPAVWPLYAGQNIKIGEVQVYDDGTNVYVRYVITTPGWKITEIHLDMANSVALIPQHNGNPTPGHFAIKHSYSPGVTAPPLWQPLCDYRSSCNRQQVLCRPGNGLEMR
jgi:hypothetical protein